MATRLKKDTARPPGQAAEGEDKDPQFAYTLARGLQVLRAFEDAPLHLGNRDIAARVGIPRPTVARLTRTLAMLGYLKYDAATARYRLAASLFTLGYPLLSKMNVRQIARPLMQRLAERANGASSLGMREGLNIILVESCIAPNAVSRRPDVGATRRIVTTSLGRAYLAGLDEGERDKLMAEIRASSQVEWDAFRRDMDRELNRFQAHGFCIAKDTAVKGDIAASVPFRVTLDAEPELMVVNCVVPDFQIDEAAMARDFGPKLVALVQQVQRALGGR
jgi:DNA-binding IclR family transcriptional regulator